MPSSPQPANLSAQSSLARSPIFQGMVEQAILVECVLVLNETDPSAERISTAKTILQNSPAFVQQFAKVVATVPEVNSVGEGVADAVLQAVVHGLAQAYLKPAPSQ